MCELSCIHTLYVNICMYVCLYFILKKSIVNGVYCKNVFTYEMSASLQNYILLIRQIHGQKKI